MDIREYQKLTHLTAIYPKDAFVSIMYLALGLGNEAGEVQGKIKKIIRDQNGTISLKDREAILKELGDVQWYISEIANYFNLNLEDILEENIKKLESRKRKGTLSGDGDDR